MTAHAPKVRVDFVSVLTSEMSTADIVCLVRL